MKFANTILTLLLVAVFSGAKAQELQARVTVLSNRVATSVDKRIFTTLQTQLTNLLNNRKWTSDFYKPQEVSEFLRHLYHLYTQVNQKTHEHETLLPGYILHLVEFL